ncbi:heme ABC transporter ATP-binding protein [Paenibacillus whitsoniae]|uniref:Heme ABC transporter ATP-binding protein n=1 Tax=Paenibacillus whitsoniae TaxID=2496558 RepID=A0A430JCK2_9BACL|nr:heme ABC transporter ATP-binding protein [Paenibacillus whitsoniae]RTE08773.1 heme ABC transporter ATP-binding protein [Paenibacillus whitsoniae]
MIDVKQLSYKIKDQAILKEISFQVAEGEFFGIIGPNGSGKSTLLRQLSGVDPVRSGEVRLGGKPVGSYSRKELAKWLAVLQQDALPPVGFTVREVVEMGRFPFQNWLGEEKEDADALITAILQKLELTALAERAIERLSGGERQRAALAKVMAQQPGLLLLDEPTTFLDIGYQIQMMDYIANWQKETGLTTVAVLHDLNLAAQYCSRLLVIHDGRAVAVGTPEQILTSELIAQVYGTTPIILKHPVSEVPQVLLQPGQ